MVNRNKYEPQRDDDRIGLCEFFESGGKLIVDTDGLNRGLKAVKQVQSK